MISIEGSVTWQIVTAKPIAIRFTPTSGGQNLTASLSPDKNFSIHVPNMMSYEVYIQSENTTEYRDWYFAHQLEVRAGVNVVCITMRIGL